MKYLSRIVCGVTLASSVASCAVSAEPAPPPPHVQSTPEAVGRNLNEIFRMADELGRSIVWVRGASVACACGPIVQPNGPGPPPPQWNPAAVKRAIQALQAMERAYEANKTVTIKSATAAQ